MSSYASGHRIDNKVVRSSDDVGLQGLEARTMQRGTPESMTPRDPESGCIQAWHGAWPRRSTAHRRSPPLPLCAFNRGPCGTLSECRRNVDLLTRTAVVSGALAASEVNEVYST